MSFDLKTTVQPDAELSPQQKKLNRLIEKIEQQKIDLATWEKAQADIQQHARKTLVPVYNELHTVLFQQLEQLWQHLHGGDFSKAEILQLDEKIQHLAAYLKESKALSAQQANTIEEIDIFYQQHTAHTKAKKTKKKPFVETDFVSESAESDEDETAFDSFDNWGNTKHEQQREYAKLKKQQEKREQAQKMAEQSLKTVYLKIASSIHPDREQDESKKLEKTEMLQHANAAYEKQDLFYLLKLQIQIEQNRGASQKGLSAEQVKFYKLALDAQSQKLDDEINEIIDSLVWSENAKIAVKKSKGKLQINDLYKQIDADTSALKQQVKWEKERLKYMSRVKGLEMLLENGAL
ncbi:molecular chaperone DnaJ [Acinetobacter sp. ANC 5414]|uniref:molecular chaperone DnaJ n=1 Tax=Acinetobacter sp. ANC 5414 TaxID=2731251 RepID=UPI00148F75CF|nr:molecular chaperone DnaJ [Acinetobacter sp. ANC 5414]NNG99397.1 molecular chaperone DnaJ [Acinetobacter sp. ANC 5414]